MKWCNNLFVFGLMVTMAALMFHSQMTSAFTMEGVSKTPDGKCLRDQDGLQLAPKEAKTLPGCIEHYCRLFDDKMYIQQSTCPSIDVKAGCKTVEGAPDKPFPDCCKTQQCA